MARPKTDSGLQFERFAGRFFRYDRYSGFAIMNEC